MPFIILGLLAMVFGVLKWIYQLLFKRGHRAEELVDIPLLAPIPIRQSRPNNMPEYYQYQEEISGGGHIKRKRTYWGEPLYDEIAEAIRKLR